MVAVAGALVLRWWMSFLGIDLGTSGIRALLLGLDGDVLAVAEGSYGVSRPHAGWSEQDPQDWIDALHKVIAELRDEHPAFAEIEGIGVAGHMHGATLLGADDQVLRPCILWNDTRSHLQARAMDAEPAFREISGNIVFPGFTAPKLAWLRENEPGVFEKVAKVLLPAAYLNLYLTGEHVGDLSDASGTSWLNISTRDWSEQLLKLGHMRLDQMPRVVEGSAPAGVLRRSLADQWGLSRVVTVAGGAGDNAAAACGLGVMEEGRGFVSLGTSGVLLMARDGMQAAPETALHTFCHAVPERWYQMSVMLSAADSLTWLSSIVGQSPGELTASLGETLRIPGAVKFAPYLSGERTPYNDAQVRAGFSGISTSTTVQDLTHAVLSGVCFGLRDGLEAMRGTGASCSALYVTGGGAASHYWLQMLATVLDTPLLVPEGREFGASLGAARLGMAAATGAPLEQIMLPATTAEVVRPVIDQVAAYDAAYAKFRKLYPAFQSLS